MVVRVLTNAYVLGAKVPCQLSLDISLKGERLVINGHQYSSDETKSIIWFFRYLEGDK